MNDDEKEKDPYQGVKIQRLPTIGKAFDNRGAKWSPTYETVRVKGKKKKKLLEQIAKALKD